MATLWLLTGSTENWFEGISRKAWGFPENPRNSTLWKEVSPNDIGIFHATKRSAYWSDLQPSIVGYGVIGSKDQKQTQWWDDEIQNRRNM